LLLAKTNALFTSAINVKTISEKIVSKLVVSGVPRVSVLITKSYRESIIITPSTIPKINLSRRITALKTTTQISS
jgi:hypothetical protein